MKNELRYTYISGCRSYEREQEALEDAFNNGEISDCEMPKIESYSIDKCTFNALGERKISKVQKWKVTLLELV